MMISERIQAFIHASELGGGSRWLRYFTLAVAVFALVVLYDLRAYRNFNSPEAMDAAQVARNLAEGRGYSTDFVRPFSLFLVQKHHRAAPASAALVTNLFDAAQITTPHPDLANPPLYPTLLAGLFKLTSPNWKAQNSQFRTEGTNSVAFRTSFWTEGGRFMRYPPEVLIAIFNQLLLLVVVGLTFFIAKKLFDDLAAWLAAGLVLGSDLLWRFSVSGLSTMLLLVIFLGLVWCLIHIEELARAELPEPRRLFLLAASAGVLLGLGLLTRYSFGWVLVPVVVFQALFGGARRTGLAIATVLSFAIVVSPWIIRNLAVSGTYFGTAGYAIIEGTGPFGGTRLMQSINPDLNSPYYWVLMFLKKLVENLRTICPGELLRLGDGWMGVLFLAGLLLGLRNTSARRLRYFALMCLAVFIVAEALGRTFLFSLTPELNSENLLALQTPLVVIFGVAFFLTLLNQMNVPVPQMRLGVIALLVVIACQPLFATLLPKTDPRSYPPYEPTEIQKVSAWMHPDELLMSDIPWGVAWYGGQQCAWITINSQYEFFLLNDNIAKPVRGLYLTMGTLNARLFSECLQGGVDSWGTFVLKTVAANQIPPQFPLRVAPLGLNFGFFLTDRERWQSER